MPKFVSQPKKSKGRSGKLWENARRVCLRRSSICWICAGECPDFSWKKPPFESAAIDMTLAWPHPGSASVDHIITLKEISDPNSPLLWSQENLRPAHLKCNSARGDGTRKKPKETRTSRNWVA